MKKEERDALDFGRMDVPKLFRKLFVPTLMSMLFSAMFNLADGIFVGHGVGSDALAAVNIAAPIFMIFSSLAMMLGSGVSVVAATHLSHGNVKAASINVTQAFSLGLLIAVAGMAVMLLFPEELNTLFGGSERLEQDVVVYLHWVSWCATFCTMVGIIGMFVIRLDGSPRYAMLAEVIPAVANIFLDWLFIFPLGWGIRGAAFASSLSFSIGLGMTIYYMLFMSKTIRLYRPKFSLKAIRLTLRNLGYQVRLGFSTFLGEVAISVTMIVGNFMFMSRLREDGVAAFSTACYLFPLIFMFGNAVAQSALPIISYNHGAGNAARVRQSRRIAIGVGAAGGLAITLLGVLLSPWLVGMFLDSSTVAHAIAIEGLPWFAAGWLCLTLNLVLIGYHQSMGRAGRAVAYMLLRGFILIIPCFILLPHLLGDRGLWLAVPVAETLTLSMIVVTREKR